MAIKFRNLNNYDAIYLPNINKHFQKQSLKYFKLDEKKIIDGSKIRHIQATEIIIPQHPYWEKNLHQLKDHPNIHLVYCYSAFLCQCYFSPAVQRFL